MPEEADKPAQSVPRRPLWDAERTAEYFAERRARADFAAFDRIMSRPGGEPPRPGDEMPETE